MAARTRRILHDDATRKKIQTSQLINRLQGHALGEHDMTPTQVQAAQILLKKALPDLNATELSGPDGEAIPLGIDVRVVSSPG